MAYSQVLLDFDHTLLDTETSLRAAFEDAMTTVDIRSSERRYDQFSVINRSLWTAVERGELTPSEVHVERFRLLLQELGSQRDPQQMAAAFATGMGIHGELYPGARSLLGELSQCARLALVTNGLSAIQRTRIARLQLEQYFDAIVISAEVGVAKPDSAIFDLVFDQLGWPTKSRVLMVGDSLASDIKGGVDYGISTCWFNPRQQQPSLDLAFTYQVSDLASIASIVSGGSIGR